MNLPKNTPTQFCKAFIKRELKYNKEKGIWMSYWPVMESMINRADELSLPFQELIDNFGYSDKFEGVPPSNTYIWLTLELIWHSFNFKKEDVIQVRNKYKELKELKKDIVMLASQLASKLQRQDDLYESSGFSKPEYQFHDDLLDQASEGNYLYESHVSEKIKSLTYQYDLKYWPSRSDLLSAIAEFEEVQPNPTHSEYPEHVITGRQSDFKDFVIAFDNRFDEPNGLPSDFRFSHNAMADIINVILDLPADNLATDDAVRNVRHRYQNNKH